jgi:hypothetical protein
MKENSNLNFFPFLNTYHCTDFRTLDPDQMCTSLATGFYIRDEESFEDWQFNMKKIQNMYKD